MMSLDTASRSFCPCIIRENFARFVFSQSCSVFFSVVSFRFAIIWLRLFLSSSSSPCASTVICPREIAARHRRCDVCDCAHLKREAVCHRVHVVGERAPRSCCVRNFCLAAELSFSSYFLRDACYFVREHAQRVHHRVDRVLELENLTAHFDGDLLRQVSFAPPRS